MDKPFLTTSEIAKYCYVTPVGVQKWIASGKLRAHATPGGHFRIKKQDFMEFLKDYDMPVPEEIKKDFRPKILVVDDDRAVIKNVEKMLKAKIEGVEIATAGDGFEACIIAGHWTPDLIILDLIMPNMNGIEVIRSLKSSALTRNVSILVYSGFLDDNMINNLKEQGVKHFLHKPEKLSEMMKMVVTILTPA